ncbi:MULTISPECIES: DUF397 domain-containing protein [unclassified Streptomyces]|uniref:DUF397 domain-containing protein n=1 Tax=unclassified Streptomyces TaxID=2593676 RepID=UPI001660BC00|nr:MULTISPECIES: DUF397 domain-containing protein [unclassified Streptomyces]MBD0709566.1 DUF397 domain-containing protein [Streptomyces sp. CBMA291]MBD0715271.1 DUF397 domain-containing protein [Streptomyces sp. CBMA370]MBD0717887.1 DUF397 domain-containing protein [Streptomyces sp. CBMA370]
MNDPQWFKSSYSSNGGNCVEVAHNLVPALGVVPLRDSKAPSGPALAVPALAFVAFIEGVKGGQLGA